MADEEAVTDGTRPASTTKPTINLEKVEDPQEDAARTKYIRQWLPQFNAWGVLLSHGAASLAVALSIVLALNGYEALDDEDATHATYVNGRLILRVADVTTLLSTAMVIVKLLVSWWTTTIVWACAHHLASTGKLAPGPENNQEAKDTQTEAEAEEFMSRWKLPPWFKRPFMMPKGPGQWLITFALLLSSVQVYIPPLLTGAVNWTSRLVPVDSTNEAVAAVDPRADFDGWYWYRYSGYAQSGLSKRSYLRYAAGYAALAWGDVRNAAENGTSLTGNGCRHVVTRNEAVGPNSTLIDAVLPCINIHSITWYRPTDDFTTRSPNLTLVDDDPALYYDPGVTVVYNNSLPWNSSQVSTSKPIPTLHEGPMTFWVMVKRVGRTDAESPCTHLDPTIFGSVDSLGWYVQQWSGNCYWYGLVNFTAGVTTSKQSRYLSGRVVEDQTPLDQVVFDANPWVLESLWLLPDLMTMIAVMNSTLLPTYDNIDGYVQQLLRQSYLAAWDMCHDSFDSDQISLTYKAIPGISRQLAEVSFARVFSWLGVCLLMTGSGFLLLVIVLDRRDIEVPEETLLEVSEERKSTGWDILNQWSSIALDMVKKIF
ncbi:hypothetical protein EDB81DRAFT_830811 [Dactylonectria macrodidyma]|uniref:Uncharacterized protein n=1 Tax=Dactylonectria macrodidyma TaxID=307937 RepID=A0A9P9D1G3_9HYPO|nr:hypothetical protein EDB81DRAFT_830811 [Dactylonectria macrodidyma]